MTCQTWLAVRATAPNFPKKNGRSPGLTAVLIEAFFFWYSKTSSVPPRRVFLVMIVLWEFGIAARLLQYRWDADLLELGLRKREVAADALAKRGQVLVGVAMADFAVVLVERHVEMPVSGLHGPVFYHEPHDLQGGQRETGDEEPGLVRIGLIQARSFAFSGHQIRGLGASSWQRFLSTAASRAC